MAEWTLLPEELWGLIASLLPSLPDFLRFAAACRLFRSAAASSRPPVRPNSWLLLSTSPSLSFSSLTHQRTFRLPPLPGPLADSYCVGSSLGWLILVDPTLRAHLFHPLSGLHLPLPRLPAAPMDRIYPPRALRDSILLRATLSADPFDGGDVSICTVLAIHGFFGKLLFCRILGGSRSPSAWTPLPDPFGIFSDVVHYRGRFYATSAQADVTVCDLEAGRVSVSLLRNGFTLFPNYLFDLEGELLFVERERMVSATDDGFASCSTSRIVVLKMDSESGVWSETESIGGRSLFLTHNRVVPLPVGEFPLCEEDSIYFADYCYGVGGTVTYLDMGMCEVKMGRIWPLEWTEMFEQLLVPGICFTPILRAGPQPRYP